MSLESLIKILKREDLKSIKDAIRSPVEAITEQRSAKPRRHRGKKRKTDIRTLRKRRRAADRKRHIMDRSNRYHSSIVQMYYHLRREAKRRQKRLDEAGAVEPKGNWQWDITLAEWSQIWGSCPAIEVGTNVWVPAWKLRGRKNGDVKLNRIDTSKAWSKDNLMIVKGKEILYEPR